MRRVAALLSIVAVAALGPRQALAVTAIPDIFDGYAPSMGGIHFHTGYSDGAPDSIPADAYATGKASGMSFMFVTEHSEWLRLPVEADSDCLTDPLGRPIQSCVVEPENGGLDKWGAQAEQMADASDADFIALRGFEWSSPTEGHVGVLLSTNHEDAYTDGGAASMEGFWRWFGRDASLGGGADALAIFNHPGREKEMDLKFDGFAYVPAADARVVGLEVFNRGNDYFFPQPDNVGSMIEALDKGWHVGAIGAADDHGPNWGLNASRPARTVLLLRDGEPWTEGSVREAMTARRFYATQDPTNLSVSLTADGEPMGSRLNRPNESAVTLSAATDADSVEILTNGGALVAEGPSPLTADVTSGWGEAWYLARATSASGKKAYSSPIWIGANAHPAGEWLSGDLHVHTINGHDTCDSPFTDSYERGACEEPWTWSFTPAERIQMAKERGLDYLAISDHNNIRSQFDPLYADEDLVLVPAYENSLPGHAQMLGATQCYESALPAPIESVPSPPDCTTGDGSTVAVLALRDAIRADGGAFQINHPGDIGCELPDVPDSDIASQGKWPSRYGHDVVPDSVEVWNIAPWAYQPPNLASNDNDAALAFYDGFLDLGHHVTATGGSDSHWRLTSPVQGAGQPTTWVCSTGRSWQDVVAGIRAGRTSVSHQPPAYGAVRLFLEADADGNGTFESIATRFPDRPSFACASRTFRHPPSSASPGTKGNAPPRRRCLPRG